MPRRIVCREIPQLQRSISLRREPKRMRISRAFACLLTVALALSIANAQTWTPAPTYPAASGGGAGAAWLMTNGVVVVHTEQAGAGTWYKLTPNKNGSYAHGTWTQIASPVDSYQPIFFASAVLPDGRLLIEGGEYNLGIRGLDQQGRNLQCVDRLLDNSQPSYGMVEHRRRSVDRAGERQVPAGELLRFPASSV